MLQIDFKEHNRKSAEIWKAYRAGNPTRVPVTIYADTRNWIHEPGENLHGVTLSEYLKDSQLMLECQVRAQDWKRHNILSDDGMGDPEDGWSIILDYQNYLEPVWFGAELKDGLEPHALAFLGEEDKHAIFEKGIPDAFSGIGGDVRDRYEWFLERMKSFRYRNLPVAHLNMPFDTTGTDGPVTIACGIRGVEDFLCDLVDDPDYALQLLDFITTATIARIRKVRAYLGQPDKSDDFGMADDSIVLLSPSMYREMILPFHRRIFDELTTEGGSRGIHLCGDAQRFFPVIACELGVRAFDTGFPIDFGRLYDELPKDTCVYGGPEIGLLHSGTVEQVERRVREVLASGVMQKSGKFVLREGNALAPGTPLDNVNAIYRTCERYGNYP